MVTSSSTSRAIRSGAPTGACSSCSDCSTKATTASGRTRPGGRTTRPRRVAQAKALIEYFAERRRQFPGMHVYHYNHTERSALESMAAEHGVGSDAAAGVGGDGPVRRPAERGAQLVAGRRRVVRAQVDGAARGVRAQPRHRQGCRCRRRVRALHDDERRRAS